MINTIKAAFVALFCFGSPWLYAGATSTNDSHANSPCDSADAGGCNSAGMPIYSFKSMLAGLSLRDTPLSYAPPVGSEIAFVLYYNEKDSDQNAVFSGWNLGQKWTSNWLSFIQDDPNSIGNNVLQYVAGGGAYEYKGYQPSTGKFSLQQNDAAVLVRLDNQSYELRKNDGRIERFSFAENKTSYPRKVYLTERVDPQGNTVRLSYDNQMRLNSITDAIGQISYFHYENMNFPLVVTRISDPFGRQVLIEYDTQGRLSAITDAIGLRSSFTYQDSSYFISAMTTPYGRTSFEKTQGFYGNSSAAIQAIDPLGYVERTEYRHSAPGVGYSESQVPAGMGMLNNYLNYRNSFYWNKSAFAQACSRVNNSASCDYTRAQIKHFLHNEKGQTARTLESIKKPLESRVWFNYSGQANTIYTGSFDKPKQVGRVLSDGSTQLYEYQYNTQGNVILSKDPDGRTTYYRYAENGMDVVHIQQKNGDQLDTAFQAIYNDQHLPTQITDAAGQTYNYSYNQRGQRIKISTPLGQTTHFNYDNNGYLSHITNTFGHTQQRFSYDNYGRVASITDSKGYALNYQYDALNRLTAITYPDRSQKIFTWDKLDLAAITDREGKTTTYEYDANRNLIKEINPLGQSINYSYYPNGDLHTLTDANGNTTTWERDIQGRVIQKIYADNQGDAFNYDLVGRVAQKQDALGQITQYRYSKSNLLQEKRYLYSQNPTTNIQIEYDQAYPRPNKITDGLGVTTYQYYAAGELGANQLKSIQGEQSWQNWQYRYDALGREITQVIAGSSDSSEYDLLNRLAQKNNSLGKFQYNYLDDTQQLSQLRAVDMPFQWQRDYLENNKDRRLKTQKYQQIKTIKMEWEWPLNLILPAPAPQTKTQSILNYDFNYSPEGLLRERTTETEQTQGHPHLHLPVLHWLLGMHHGQHTQSQTIGGTEQFSYDDNGRLTTVTKQRRKTGEYSYDPMGNIIDMEESGFAYQQRYNELNQARPFTYDANGNVIDDGQHSYAWDGENRLVKIKNKETGLISEFIYDAYSRRTRETHTEASGQIRTIHNLWCGEKLCAQADAQGKIKYRYFEQGEWHSGQKYFYVQDQIGSVTAMLDTQGKIAGAALYSPYGKLLQSQGVQANIAYAGLYHHKETGLYLATYRGYNPFTARWLNRDPIKENGGLNLYEYVGGNPISYVDFLGLYEIIFGSKGTSSNAVYDQKVTVFDGSVELGKFDGSSTPNPYKPSNPSLRGTNAYPQIQGGTYGVNHGTHRGEPALVVNNNSNVPTTTINPNFPEQGAYATFIHIHKGFSPSWKGSAGCPTIEPSQWSDFINAIPNGDGKVMLP